MRNNLYLFVSSLTFLFVSWRELTQWRIAFAVAGMVLVSWVVTSVIRRLSLQANQALREPDVATALAMIWACQIALLVLAVAHIDSSMFFRVAMPSFTDGGIALGGMVVLAWWQLRLWRPTQEGSSNENV